MVTLSSRLHHFAFGIVLVGGSGGGYEVLQNLLFYCSYQIMETNLEAIKN